MKLEPFIGPDTLFEAEDDLPEEWGRCLGFYMTYRGNELGHFEHSGTGPEHDLVRSVVQELLSQVQDEVSVMTTEPWPLVLDGRRDMAMAAAAIEGDELQMWYGEREAPALRVPTVSLV